MKELIALSHELTLKARAIERFIYSETFIFNPEDKDVLIRLIQTLNLGGLKTYVANIRRKKLITMSFRDLRDLASRRHLPNYSRLNLLELIEANRRWEETNVGQTSDSP